MLTPEQKRRYRRHIVLDGIGLEGQEKLLSSRVLVVGAGGLGSPVLQYLAAAGVGFLGIIDGDTVSISNLQRQVIHSTADLGKMKVDSAKACVKAINPDVEVQTYGSFLSESNALEVIEAYDFIIDATDNFAPKYLINDACVMLDKPFCMGGISRFRGQLMTHIPGSACYRCLFPEPPVHEEVETCATVGVLGSIAGICGTMQATECIKYLTGAGQLLVNRCLTFDALSMEWMTFDIEKNSDCEVCGNSPTITTLKEYAFKPCQVK